MEFEKKLKNFTNLINDNLNKHLDKQYPEIIYEAMGHSVNAGGKRFRPILLLATYQAVSKNESLDDVLDFATALEFIHTYSLIHDDLPSMDDDDYRRGILTCHKKFGEAIAILAGDGLLNLAFEVMTESLKNNFEPKYLDAMEIISKSSGAKGMIGGQVADILSENKKGEIKKEELIFIHENKTGKLISSAMIAGALLARADKDTIKKFQEISYLIGIAFQIQDDILDFTSSTEVLGKPVLSDEKNNKATYVSLFGLEKAQKDYLKYSSEILEKLENLGFKDEFVYYYIKKMIDRQN